MQHFDLGFARIARLESDIYEVTAAPAIEIDAGMSQRFHRFLGEEIGTPCHLLIDKQHDYSLSLEAMRSTGDHPLIRGMAFLVYRHSTARIVELQRRLMRNRELPVATFRNRELALDWLRDLAYPLRSSQAS